MKATVRSVSTLEGVDGDTMGIIMEGTEIQWFKDPGSAIKLKNTSNRYVHDRLVLSNRAQEFLVTGRLRRPSLHPTSSSRIWVSVVSIPNSRRFSDEHSPVESFRRVLSKSWVSPIRRVRRKQQDLKRYFDADVERS